LLLVSEFILFIYARKLNWKKVWKRKEIKAKKKKRAYLLSAWASGRAQFFSPAASQTQPASPPLPSARARPSSPAPAQLAAAQAKQRARPSPLAR